MTQLEEETGFTIHEFPSDELYPSCPIRLFPLKNTTQHSNVSKTLKLAAGRNSQRFATVGNHERRIDDVFHVGASLSEAERDAKSFDSRNREANGQSLAKTVTLTIILDVSLLSHQKRRFPLSFTVVRFFFQVPGKKKRRNLPTKWMPRTR